MKKSALILLIILLPLACITTPPGESPEVQRALDEVMERWIEGLKTENLDLLMSAYWPEAELIIAGPEGEQVFAGFDAIAGSQDEGFRSSDIYREMEVFKAGSEATPEGTRWIYEVHGPGFMMFNIFLFQEREGEWRIIHQVIEAPPPQPVAEGAIRVVSPLQAWADHDGNGMLEGGEYEECIHGVMRLLSEPHPVENPVDEMFDYNGDGHIDGLEQLIAGRILFMEQLRRLPVLAPEMVPFFDIDENDYLQFWETQFSYSIILWNEVWPDFEDRLDENRDGRLEEEEIERFKGRVWNIVLGLPLEPEDARLYRWRGKEALFEWADLDKNGVVEDMELHDLGARTISFIDSRDMPVPLVSSLGDYFDRNRDSQIGAAESETMRQVLIFDQLDRLFEVGASFNERSLAEILDLDGNGRFDQPEQSMLLELFFSEPGWDEQEVTTDLEKRVDRNQDGLLQGPEHHSFETYVVGAAVISWLRRPEEDQALAEGWPVSTPLDELADINADGLVDRVEERQMAEGLGSPHPVRSPFDRRIDFNGNGEVETFEIVKARRAGEQIAAEEEGVYPVETIIDDHMDLNRDGQVDEEEMDRILRFLSGEIDAVQRGSMLYGLFDMHDDGGLTERELVEAIDRYLLPRPIEPGGGDEQFEREQDRNGDGFLDPEEIGIAAGVSAGGEIATIPERLERRRWEVAQAPEETVEQPDRQKRYESDFYKKLGQIQDKKLAVVGITSGTKTIDQETASGVMVFIENAFVNVGKVRVVDRQNIAKIAKEYEFQASDLTDETTAVEIGKLSGADIIVIGSISYVGKIYYLNIKLISVETAEIIGSSIADAQNATEFFEMCNEAVFTLF